MPRARQSAAILAELTAATAGASARVVDVCSSLRLCDVEGTGAGARWVLETEEELIRVGGRWDRREKRWLGEASAGLVWRVHRGQEEAARWLAEWLRRYGTDDWAGFARVWSALLVSGRRAGKSHLAMLALAAFAIASPGAIVWCISPTLEAGAELDRALQELLPRDWYSRKEAATGSALTYRLINGTAILLRSGHKTAGLKAGRADFVVLNEAQMQAHRAYVNLRGAVADRGGLVLVCANPPDEPRGRWVETLWNDARSGTVDSKGFELDARKNPFVEHEALSSLEREVDEKDFAREVLGVFTPIGSIVFHAWDDRENWKDPPLGLVDVTAEVTRAELGRAYGYVVGQDYQRTPAMVALVMKLFRDPADPDREVLCWVVDECIVDDADENGLLDELEAMPRWSPGDGRPETRERSTTYRGWTEVDNPKDAPVHCGVIADASGFFQDGAHSVGRTSDRALAARRWTAYRPQKDSDRNPAIVERMKAGNARLKNASGRRRMFVARHCLHTAEALRAYPLKNGFPDRRHALAHIADACTYPIYRLFGRPVVRRSKLEYRSAGKHTRAAELAGW